MLSGFLPGVLIDEQQNRHDTALPHYFIAHGTADTTVPFHKAEQAKVALLRFGARVEFHSEHVAHKVGSAGIKALRAWFEHCFSQSGGE